MVATVTVKDSAGTDQTVNTLPTLGQAAKAASLPVALASDTGTLPVSLAALPALAAGSAAIGSVIVAPAAGIGQQSTAASLSVATSKDQDPIFDHTNGTKTSVTTSVTILTPPAGCLYARVSSDVDVFINTAGNAVADDGTSIRIIANQPEVIPVVAGTAVKAATTAGSATVRCTPLRTR